MVCPSMVMVPVVRLALDGISVKVLSLLLYFLHVQVDVSYCWSKWRVMVWVEPVGTVAVKVVRPRG